MVTINSVPNIPHDQEYRTHKNCHESPGSSVPNIPHDQEYRTHKNCHESPGGVQH